MTLVFITFKLKKIMKKIIVLVLFGSLALFNSCGDDDDKSFEEIVVVANRAGGSISFIDAKTDVVTSTLSIPNSEPMYVVYAPKRDKIYVGDRAGRKVHVVNPVTKTLETSINVGNGVFHMWANPQGTQLWVNNDIDNTVSVINLETNVVLQTINLNAKPHDVFISNDGTKAYISIITSNASTPDKVYLYNTTNFTKTNEIEVGKDPHLFYLPNSNKLFVPCQSGKVFVLNGDNLNVIASPDFLGAHGVFASPDQSTVYVTNISGSQLYAINSISNTAIGTPTATAVATPHNIVVTNDGKKMFVAHSGATATKVTTYSLANGVITPLSSQITAGTNPFGIAIYRRAL